MTLNGAYVVQGTLKFLSNNVAFLHGHTNTQLFLPVAKRWCVNACIKSLLKQCHGLPSHTNGVRLVVGVSKLTLTCQRKHCALLRPDDWLNALYVAFSLQLQLWFFILAETMEETPGFEPCRCCLLSV